MHNLLDPAILFFVLGLMAGVLRSNLEIPPAVAKFLSLYLLMALGLKGGFSMAESGWSAEMAAGIGVALVMAMLVPAIGYALLRHRLGAFDAAAVAAAYGSVSAVTFVTAMQYLDHLGVAYGGHMAVAMVLMESPAIIFAVLMANLIRARSATSADQPVATVRIRHVLHESMTDGAHLLLLGALAIGFISGEAGRAMMQPFAGDLFKGMLAFFLLDMGLQVARNLGAARKAGAPLLAYAMVAPPIHALIALALAAPLGVAAGDATLLMVLAASASYIVVPAVLRHAIPEASPALYFGLSLGVTFPLNLLVGIPLYATVAQRVIAG